MRKCFAFLILMMLMLQLFVSLPVSAATAMHATAKAADPLIDGVARASEYGEAFVVTGDNTVSWGGRTGLDSPVEYRFAWSEKGLYMAVTYDALLIKDASLLQLDCNPGGQIYEGQQGLFFTVYPDHRVTLHNHRTAIGDASYEPYDLSNQVQIASRTRDGLKTTEVLLPIEAFRITDSNFMFTEGTMEASAFVMLFYNGKYHSGGAISGYLENWTLNEIGLGTLVLEGATGTNTGTDYESTQIPEFMPTLLFGCIVAAGSVLLLGFVGIVTVVIIFIMGRVRARR